MLKRERIANRNRLAASLRPKLVGFEQRTGGDSHFLTLSESPLMLSLTKLHWFQEMEKSLG